MRILLIRHGQTEWNAQERVQGRTDIPLDEKGRLQAEAIAWRLRDVPLERAYTSPLRRARETAERIAAACGCSLAEEPRLTEIEFGIWEGLTFAALKRDYAGLWEQWSQDPEACRVPGAESIEQIRRRSIEAVSEMLRLHDPQSTVAVISHTMPIKMIVANYLGLRKNAVHCLHIHNCAYTELEVQSACRGGLITLNERRFLQERGLA